MTGNKLVILDTVMLDIFNTYILVLNKISFVLFTQRCIVLNIYVRLKCMTFSRTRGRMSNHRNGPERTGTGD
jgi:hypothetical protein